jgi:AcrR family transcriptional regulator
MTSPSNDDRERALLAARYLLTRGGVRQLKIDAVLRESGLSTRAFYRNFDDKHDLVKALIQQSSAELAARTREVLEANPDPLLALHDWLEVVLDSGSRDQPSLEAALIWHSYDVRLVYADGVEQAVALVLEPLVDGLRRLKQRGYGHIRPRQDAAAFLLLARAVQAQLVAPAATLTHDQALEIVWSLIRRACTLEAGQS